VVAVFEDAAVVAKSSNEKFIESVSAPHATLEHPGRALVFFKVTSRSRSTLMWSAKVVAEPEVTTGAM